MSGPNIILDPKLMFQSLHDLEDETIDIKISLHFISSVLQDVASLTYAIGFGALIKKAETDINRCGFAAVATNNAFNVACKDVINKLVDKFAAEGAKSHYNTTPFEAIHLKVNVADRAAIYPQRMKDLFTDLSTLTFRLDSRVEKLKETYEHTKAFWTGTSAEKTRHNFISKVVPVFDDLLDVLDRIYFHGIDWINETVKFEASLGTP